VDSAATYLRQEALPSRDGTSSGLTGASGNPIDLGEIYEVRAFHPGAELRWRNDPGHARRHQTVILAEQNLGLALTMRPPHEVIDRLDQTYLLWGQGSDPAGLAPGWSRLSTARIGSLDVPLADVPRRERVLLRAVEYLAEFDDGNVSVLDERLVRLEVDRG
jgi:CRISPR-associated protein (TIGR03984 family)